MKYNCSSMQIDSSNMDNSVAQDLNYWHNSDKGYHDYFVKKLQVKDNVFTLSSGKKKKVTFLSIDDKFWVPSM